MIDPVFLVGAHRSGTTLLRLMIDSHPQIHFPGESEFITQLMNDNCEPPPIQEYHDFLQFDRVFLERNLTLNQNLSFTALVNDFLVQENTQNLPVYGTTIHVNFACLAKLWPQAKFIYLYRDPRDVAKSCVKLGWSGNTWYGVEGWLKAEQYLSRLQKMITPNQLLLISYEDLIKNPPEILTQICRFIGVEFSEKMFDFIENSTYNYPDPKYLAQWKKQLSPQEIQWIEYRVGELLSMRGYEASEQPPIAVNALLLGRLKISNVLGRLNSQIKRYGLSLVILEIVGRRLKIKSLKRKVQLKLNEIRRQRVK
ncbi:MAG: sulfotransferase family protein [Synechocystis sp.]|jgi:hypothetical protein